MTPSLIPMLPMLPSSIFSHSESCLPISYIPSLCVADPSPHDTLYIPIRWTINLLRPTKHHSTHISLHTLPHLHNPPISTHVQAFPHPPQTLHIPTPIPLRYIPQPLHPHPYPPRRFAHHPHLTQHRLAIPVFQPDPQPSRRHIRLRNDTLTLPLFTFPLCC